MLNSRSLSQNWSIIAERKESGESVISTRSTRDESATSCTDPSLNSHHPRSYSMFKGSEEKVLATRKGNDKKFGECGDGFLLLGSHMQLVSTFDQSGYSGSASEASANEQACHLRNAVPRGEAKHEMKENIRIHFIDNL